MYLSWVFGINVDFGFQEQVYVSVSKRGDELKGLYVTTGSLFIAAMVLLAVRKIRDIFRSH